MNLDFSFLNWSVIGSYVLQGFYFSVQLTLVAMVGGIVIACLYLPNGNPAPGPKFDYKLDWFKRLHERAATLLRFKTPVILVGDFNVMPTELDVYKPERWVNDALFRPET